MILSRGTLAVSILAICSSAISAFVVGNALLPTHLRHVATDVTRRRATALQSLRASATNDQDEEEGGGFVNPYTAFRKWQMNLIETKATSDPKYESALAALRKEPGMTEARAVKLAKMAVRDPILYSMERKREASELNNTPMDYSKISGFFPMEWILSGDFGWGFNKKKAREAEDKKKTQK